MARRRFLVDWISAGRAQLSGPEAHHLVRVLRAEPGQRYEITDGASLYLAEIRETGRDRVLFDVVEALEPARPPVRLVLLAALVKFDRFEWIVEKATELGVEAVQPVAAARSEKGLLEAAGKRVERWRRIARESTQQARRLDTPEIRDPQPLPRCLNQPADRRYFLDEDPAAPPFFLTLPERRQASDVVALLIGPEGGWTPAERQQAIAAGWQPVSLGSLVLRAETAAIAALAILANAWWAALQVP